MDWLSKITDPRTRLAFSLYETRIKNVLEPEHNGKFVVIDLDTGNYEVDEDDLAASRRARTKASPERLVMLRVGYGPAYRMGASFRSPDPC